MLPESEAPAGRRYLPELSLFGITLLWGATFLVTQIGLDDWGPFFFVGVRFAIAAALLFITSPRHMVRVTRVELTSSLWIGAAMTAGMALQAIGLLYIPSSKSAFITSLYVPLVPVAELIFLRRMPRRMVWVGVVMALAGLTLLAGPREVMGLTLGTGETLTILCAVATVGQIVLIGVFARAVDGRRAAMLQMAVTAALCFAMMPLTGEALPRWSPVAFGCVVVLGVGSVIIQVTMNWAQRSVSATRASLIYAGEPVYAGVIGWAAGDRLPGSAILGGALVVLSVVVSELRLGRGPKRNAAPPSVVTPPANS
ncbi:DMT family transporter [Sphingomonas sp. ID0503]|uniref:DMT family transporter n=1 Tax=Sphingomonas sp. ID0503 TaxID=3399691 RepID=UPI003AFB4564